VPPFALALVATCLIAVEQLRAERDPRRPDRPAAPEEAQPAGAIRPRPAADSRTPNGSCWASLAGARAGVNLYFAASGLALWILASTYNVPPIRTKEWPYVDVVSESANNAVRLLLGWFALVTTAVPPVSLALSYWMLGAFFMATKRFAEYRHIGNADRRRYRRSFRTTPRNGFCEHVLLRHHVRLFAGVFIVRTTSS
jgi:hypothetical protein